MKKVLLLSCLILFILSCKRKDAELPSQWSLLVGKWSGFYGDATDQNMPTTFVLQSDSAYQIWSMSGSGFYNLKGNGKVKLTNNVLHGAITLTEGVVGTGFLILNVSSDNKQLTGYLSGTENGPSAGIHFILKKE
jgi:hypothetical protein